MEKIYSYFPLSSGVQPGNLKTVITSVLIYLAACAVMGVLQAILGWIPIVGGLIRLIPGPRWLMALEQRHPVPPDFFCESLMPFRGQAVEAESLSLFASGVRCMMSGEGRAAFRRQVGRRAAQCLRMRRTSPDAGQNGGGLYACGLLNHCMEEDEGYAIEMARTFLL